LGSNFLLRQSIGTTPFLRRVFSRIFWVMSTPYGWEQIYTFKSCYVRLVRFYGSFEIVLYFQQLFSEVRDGKYFQLLFLPMIDKGRSILFLTLTRQFGLLNMRLEVGP
jgi:hypothetical protein